MRAVSSALVVFLGLFIGNDAGAAPAVERDLAYGSDAKQRLDLSVPAVKGCPTVLFIHGGSLTTGDKADEDYGKVCAPFPDAGIACANVNYRLAPGAAWPAQAEDVAAAVAWVRTNIRTRGGDPHKLFLLGHSSGARLVALVGTDERYLARQGLKTSDLRGMIPMGSITWDDELEQALPQYGRGRVEEAFRRDPANQIYANLDTYLDSWPIHHVRAGLPPFLFLIAEAETEHPPVLKTNKKFVEDASALGNRAEYRVLPGRTHYSAIRKLAEPGDAVFAIVRNFVQQLGGVQ
ncbi:MAG TPA: alpha/beta hydrolase [Thermoanaerobaculia bacterium]|nr:alpha/beta hydrolase [Thermoanaerobaculia bacterium]